MCVWFVLLASFSSLSLASVAPLHLVSEQVVHGIRFALVVACFASRLPRHLHGLCAMTLVVEDGIEVLHLWWCESFVNDYRANIRTWANACQVFQQLFSKVFCK